MKTACVIFSIFIWFFIYADTISASEEHLKQVSENEIIVQFKKGLSPDDLKQRVKKQIQTSERSQWEKIKREFLEFASYLSVESTPEERLKRINQIDTQAGVISRRGLFSDEPNLTNTYVIQVNGESFSPDQVVLMYEVLPEVVFVEKSMLSVESL